MDLFLIFITNKSTSKLDFYGIIPVFTYYVGTSSRVLGTNIVFLSQSINDVKKYRVYTVI